MPESIQNGLLLILIIGGPFFLLWLLDRRSKQKGSLFSGPTTPIKRISALIIGFIAAAAFILGLLNGTFSFLFLILAVALVGYSLGARGLLDRYEQDASANTERNLPAQLTLVNDRGLTIIEPTSTQIRNMVMDVLREGESVTIKSPNGAFVRAKLAQDYGFTLEYREEYPSTKLFKNEIIVSAEETVMAFTELSNAESGYKSRYYWAN